MTKLIGFAMILCGIYVLNNHIMTIFIGVGAIVVGLVLAALGK